MHLILTEMQSAVLGKDASMRPCGRKMRPKLDLQSGRKMRPSPDAWTQTCVLLYLTHNVRAYAHTLGVSYKWTHRCVHASGGPERSRTGGYAA